MSTRRGFILWLTGLSGAGKSTLSAAVKDALAATTPLELLDGDEVRAYLSKGLGFSREDRDTNVRRIGYVARLLARNGVPVVTAACVRTSPTSCQGTRHCSSFASSVTERRSSPVNHTPPMRLAALPAAINVSLGEACGLALPPSAAINPSGSPLAVSQALMVPSYAMVTNTLPS